MGEIVADLQQPCTWARIRGCIVLTQQGDHFNATWISRAGARPKPLALTEVPRYVQQGAWITTALPAQQHIMRMVEAPFANMAKAARVFRSLLDLEIPFPLETCRTAFFARRKTSTGRIAALGTAAREEDIHALLEALRPAQLTLMTLDMEGLALWDEWQQRDPESFKASAGVLAVAEPGRIVILCSRGGSFADLGVHRFDSTAPDAVAGLATRILRKLRSLQGFERWSWVWAGPLSSDTAWCHSLEAELVGETDLPPFRVLPNGETLLESALARRLLTRSEAHCNLLKAEEAHPAVAQASLKRDRSAMAWVSVAGVLLLAGSMAWLNHAARMTREAQTQINQRFQALTGQPNLQPGAETLVAERLITGEATHAFEQAFEAGSEQLLRDILHVGLTNAAAFEHVEWTEGHLLARGTISDASAASRIRSVLEAHGLHCQVRIGAEVQPGRLAMEITGEIQQGGST